jgi:DNA-binding beta-propeller fold protein YncE
VIDTKALKIVATIPLPGEPEGAKVDGTGKVFLNIETAHALVRIDAQQLKVTATWPLAPCTRPTGLGFDFDRKRLFSVCGNQKMVVVDSDNGKVVSVASIGDKSDGVAYDAKNALVFTSNGDGTLSVFSQQSPDSYELVQTLATHLGARTVAIDPVANTLYLVAADLGPTPSPTTEIPKPKAPVLPGTFVILKVGR